MKSKYTEDFLKFSKECEIPVPDKFKPYSFTQIEMLLKQWSIIISTMNNKQRELIMNMAKDTILRVKQPHTELFETQIDKGYIDVGLSIKKDE